MTTLTVKLEQAMKDRLAREAKPQEHTMSSLARLFIKRGLDAIDAERSGWQVSAATPGESPADLKELRRRNLMRYMDDALSG
jgi:predicted transcriptional regulator